MQEENGICFEGVIGILGLPIFPFLGCLGILRLPELLEAKGPGGGIRISRDFWGQREASGSQRETGGGRQHPRLPEANGGGGEPQGFRGQGWGLSPGASKKPRRPMGKLLEFGSFGVEKHDWSFLHLWSFLHSHAFLVRLESLGIPSWNP